MRLASYVLLVSILVIPAAIHAQVGPYLPIPLDDRMVPAEFVDGKTVVAEIVIAGLDADGDDLSPRENNLSAKAFLDSLVGDRGVVKKDDLFSGRKVFEMAKGLRRWLDAKGYAMATITVLGSPLPEDRMRLRFEVDRGQLVSKVNVLFAGNERVSTNDLMESFKACHNGIYEKYEERKYEYIAQKCVRGGMFSLGFWKARIVGIDSTVANGERNVTVKVYEGPRFRIGELKVEGNTAFSTKEIAAMLHQTRGQIADGAAFQNFVFETLKGKYDDLGYIHFEAEFEPTFTEPKRPGSDGTVDLALSIDEGRRFSVRKVEFTGVGADEAAALRNDFYLKTGETFSARKLKLAIDAVNSFGKYRWANPDVDVHVLTDEKENDVDLVVMLKREP